MGKSKGFSEMAAGLGWLPDRPDQRDYSYAPTLATLPTSVDLRANCPSVYDQGNLGSCTANAIAAQLDFDRKKQQESFINPSRLFIYYNERLDQGTTHSDSGASIRESVKAVAKYGACPESELPYDVAKFKTKPSAKCYADAIPFKALTYQRIKRNLIDIQDCLAQGLPFVIGFTVYQSFDSIGSDGIMPMPAQAEGVLGGHAVMVVGYTPDHFIVRNSWGSSWGDNGYFYMPTAYLLNSKLSSDFWTIKTVK